MNNGIKYKLMCIASVWYYFAYIYDRNANKFASIINKSIAKLSPDFCPSYLLFLTKILSLLKCDEKVYVAVVDVFFKNLIHRYDINSKRVALALIPRFESLKKCINNRELFKLHDIFYGLVWCSSSSVKDMYVFYDSVLPHFEGLFSSIEDINSKNRPVKKLDKNSSIRLGYVSHYTHEEIGNAVGPLIRSIAESHAATANREVYLYCVQWTDDKITSLLESKGVIVRRVEQFDSYGTMANMVSVIKSDALDILYADIPSSLSKYIFGNRVATFQCWIDMGFPFWISKNLDWTFLFNYSKEGWQKIDHSRSSCLQMPVTSKSLKSYNHQVIIGEPNLKEDKKYFGVFTRLVKITDEYLQIVKNILDKHSHYDFLIVGTGDSNIITSWITTNNLDQRCVFYNQNVDLQYYARRITIFLDTFPFYGGVACRDFLREGVPVVSMMTDPSSTYFFDKERVSSLVADSLSSYSNIVSELVNNEIFLDRVKLESINVYKKIHSISDTIAELEKPFLLV